MIRTTAGAELCANHQHQRPSPKDCVKAVDHTYKGDVDLSDRVVVGEPIRKSELHWTVPYNVQDDAGNEAVTVWRDVIVEEVDIANLETKIRQDVLREAEIEKKQAVAKAIQIEKERWERTYGGSKPRASSSSSRNANRDCPPCPSCECPTTSVKLNAASCQQYCQERSQTCQMSDENLLYALIFWLEDVFPPWTVPIIILCVLGSGLLYILRWILTLIFNPKAFQNYDYNLHEERFVDADLLQNIQQHQQLSPPPSTPTVGPPRESLSTQASGAPSTPAFFTPASQSSATTPRGNGTGNNPDLLSHEYDDGIYQTPSIISPSRTGDGVRRRSPYR